MTTRAKRLANKICSQSPFRQHMDALVPFICPEPTMTLFFSITLNVPVSPDSRSLVWFDNQAILNFLSCIHGEIEWFPEGQIGRPVAQTDRKFQEWMSTRSFFLKFAAKERF
jgi:hypothetical protein